MKHRVLAAKLLIHQVIFHRGAQISVPPVQIGSTDILQEFWLDLNQRFFLFEILKTLILQKSFQYFLMIKMQEYHVMTCVL